MGRELMVCTCRGDEEVTASDGCTLGTRGRPAPIAHGCEVTTGGHEAVYGYGHE
ncbi:MAG: hypothetical protein HFJ75_07730 [Eggerthellaceae bacterium]|nr:hypothetical protein [Eggerthellaceae bacterium]